MKIPAALSLALCALLLAATPARTENKCYAYAVYLSEDWKAAYQACLLLAEQGHANAQFNLGQMYRKGEGVPKDDAQAARWFRKAAEQGVALAQYDLGVMYDEGEGVPKNYAQAVRWYRQAAEQGFASAQNNLGVMYADGKGVLRNYMTAYQWFSLAAAQGNENAGENLDELETLMTPDQIAKAQKQAAEWLGAHPNTAE